MLAETYRGYPRLLSQYVTPQTLGDSLTYRLLSFPDNATIREALLDVVQMLGNLESWQETPSGTTPEQIAPIFTELAKQLTEPNMLLGAIFPFMTNQLPDNVLPCNGNTYNRADYPELYALLPASLIIDANTFQTPDLTERIPRGANDLTEEINQNGGNDSVILSESQMPSHSHTTQPHSHQFFKNLPLGIDLEGIGAPDPTAVSNTQIIDSTFNATVIVNTAGGDQPIDIKPRYLTVNYAIVAK